MACVLNPAWKMDAGMNIIFVPRLNFPDSFAGKTSRIDIRPRIGATEGSLYSFWNGRSNTNCSVHAVQRPSNDGPQHTQKQRPGRYQHQHHLFKRTAQFASGTKAKQLVNTVMPLSNVKEEIYAALDEWVAFEIEFPTVAVMKALNILKSQEQWQRIIQVSKWMLNKGQGTTFATYDLLLKAYEMDSRLDDAEILWEKLLASYSRSTPKSLFSRMMNIYKRSKMPENIIKVFEEMEVLGMRPDKDMLTIITEAYVQLGIPNKERELIDKYLTKYKYYHFKGRTMKIRSRKPMKDLQTS